MGPPTVPLRVGSHTLKAPPTVPLRVGSHAPKAPPTVPLRVGSHAPKATAPHGHLCGRAHGQEVAAVTARPRGRSHSTPRATTPPHALGEQRQQGPSAPRSEPLFSEPHSCRERGKPQRPPHCLCTATVSGSNQAEKGSFSVICRVVTGVWTEGTCTTQPLRVLFLLGLTEDCSPGGGL